MIKLLDTVSDVYINGGIFKELLALDSSIEWLTEDTALTYDIDYYYSRSGDKIISPLYSDMLSIEDIQDNFGALETLGKIILAKFSNNWKKVYESYVIGNYNAINNVDLKISENNDKTYSETTSQTGQEDRDIAVTGNRKLDETNTNTITEDNETTQTNKSNMTQEASSNETRTNTQDTDMNTYKYGFNNTNLTSGKKSETQDASSSTTETLTSSQNQSSELETNFNETQDKSKQENLSKNQTTDTTNTTDYQSNTTNEGKKDSTDNTVITRTEEGINGNKSYQELLREELELRKYLFIEQVYRDIDSVLVLGIYY